MSILDGATSHMQNPFATAPSGETCSPVSATSLADLHPCVFSVCSRIFSSPFFVFSALETARFPSRACSSLSIGFHLQLLVHGSSFSNCLLNFILQVLLLLPSEDMFFIPGIKFVQCFSAPRNSVPSHSILNNLVLSSLFGLCLACMTPQVLSVPHAGAALCTDSPTCHRSEFSKRRFVHHPTSHQSLSSGRSSASLSSDR